MRVSSSAVIVCMIVTATLRADDLNAQRTNVFRPLRDIALPRAVVDSPQDMSIDLFQPAPSHRSARSVSESHVQWAPANLHHQTLYFDELMLERHGVSVAPRLQPIFSGVHFFGSVVTLPYRLGVDQPRDIHYVFGHGRPGDPVPCVKQQLPWDPDATLLEAAAISAVFLMVP